MSRVATRGPLGLKKDTPADTPKPRKRMRQVSKKRATYRASKEGQADLDHMGKVRLQPCCICAAFGMVQTSPTDAHHCKSGRFGSLRENDRCTIPLCKCHHQGLRFDRDKSKVAYHNGQKSWEALYGPDHDYIAATLDAVEAMT